MRVPVRMPVSMPMSMSAGDRQSVINMGTWGRVGGIMSLEVVLLVSMIFGKMVMDAVEIEMPD